MIKTAQKCADTILTVLTLVYLAVDMAATATDLDSITKSSTLHTEMGATMAVDMDSTEEGDRFRGLCLVGTK